MGLINRVVAIWGGAGSNATNLCFQIFIGACFMQLLGRRWVSGVRMGVVNAFLADSQAFSGLGVSAAGAGVLGAGSRFGVG